MSHNRKQLADFQAAMLNLFYDADSPATAAEQFDQLKQQLLGDQTADPLLNVDHRMIDVAMQLTKKWGVVRHDQIAPQPDDSLHSSDQ